MTIQVNLWELITLGIWLLVTFIGGIGGVVKYTLAQMDKRLEERFTAQEQTRKDEQKRLAQQFSSIEEQLARQEQAREAGKQHWDTQFAEIDRQLSDHRERIGRLESTVGNGPTHDDLDTLHDRITDLGKCVSSLAGEFKGASHTLELIHSFLLNGGKS